MRTLSLWDQFLHQLDRSLFQHPCTAARPTPGENSGEVALTPQQNKQVIGLMRVNHAGEIAAQGLYQGQALTAHQPATRIHMQKAALEEIDHLAWCRERIEELGGRISYLDPIWYLGALVIGATAGAISDAWSLGFIAETEHQVGAHIQSHLQRLPPDDRKSQAILQQMAVDEQCHADAAIAQGAKILPNWVKQLMKATAKIMVTAAYHF